MKGRNRSHTSSIQFALSLKEGFFFVFFLRATHYYLHMGSKEVLIYSAKLFGKRKFWNRHRRKNEKQGS